MDEDARPSGPKRSLRDEDSLSHPHFEMAKSNCSYALHALQLDDFVTATIILSKTLNLIQGSSLSESFADSLDRSFQSRTLSDHDLSRAHYHCQQAFKSLERADVRGGIQNMEKTVMLLMNSPPNSLSAL